MSRDDSASGTKIAQLEAQIGELQRQVARAGDRGEIENLFSRYMYYHNAFRDDLIIDMWVSRGTPGIHAQYSNSGIYTTWESVTAYHRGRPMPTGKLLQHVTTTPVIEVAADGQTAKGVWIMTGVESGLTDPAVAANQPPFMFSPQDVAGKKVWAHWVSCKYGLDFLKQDGRWKIWHFRCYEIWRAPFEENWISFMHRTAHDTFGPDLMYFGDDGKAVFMPGPDAPAKELHNPYRTDEKQKLVPLPPTPYAKFSDTFEY